MDVYCIVNAHRAVYGIHKICAWVSASAASQDLSIRISWPRAYGDCCC